MIAANGIFIYIICIVGIIIIIGSCHCLRTYRKGLPHNVRKVNQGGEEIEIGQQRVEELYMEIDADN